MSTPNLPDLPSMVTVQSPDQIPKTLLELDQWVCWHYELRGGHDGQPSATKVPLQTDGHKAASDDATTWTMFELAFAATRQRPDWGLGFVFAKDGGIVGVDLDKCLDDQGNLKSWAQPIIERFGDTYIEVSPSGTGIKVFCRGDLAGLVASTGTRKMYRDGAIEVYQHGRFFTLTGRAFNEAPLEIEDHRRDLEWLIGLIGVRPSMENGSTPVPIGPASPLSAAELEHLREVAEVAKENDSRFAALFAGEICGFVSASEGDLSLCNYFAEKLQFNADQIDAAFRMSKRTRDKWDKRCFADGRTYGQATIQKALVRMAHNHVVPMPEHSIEILDRPVPQLKLDDFSDAGNAHRLVTLYGDNFRWCAPIRKWLLWDGTRWTLDEMEAARQLALSGTIEYLRQAAAAGNTEAQKFAQRSLDYKRLRDMLEVAKAILPIHPSQLDGQPMTLNFQNGTLDFATGELRPHRREDYITKLVHHDYNPGAECPRFLTFLDRIMGGGPDAGERELQRADRLTVWLQKAFGYSLTGNTTEKMVFICHGSSGDNGKTTLLSTFHNLINEYSAVMQINTLMTKQLGNNEQSDMADLRGAYFVMTSETEEGQRLSEARLKQLVPGVEGAKVKAARKHENMITFPETWKIWIDANHRPVVRGSDTAIWNRLCPIPFLVKIPKEEIDRKLAEKLREEAEGILSWAVQGTLRWRSEGLDRPDEVRQARNAWRKDDEPLKHFFDDCCIREPGSFTRLRDLWQSYANWSAHQGVADRLTRDQVTKRLEDLGFERKNHRFATGRSGVPELAWAGLALR